ncbi:MAG: hypothetical protein Q7R90_02785 [bacterium]|nr:hypothetical protein [bacterium]
MSRKPLSTEFLRPEKPIILMDKQIVLRHSLDETLAEAGIMVANITSDFRAFYTSCCSDDAPEDEILNVGTMRQRMPDDWLAAFHYWAGIYLKSALGAVALQGWGQPGNLLTNGKLNGNVLEENPQYGATFRWHDPARSYEEQTAQYPKRGWSFHVVHVGTRRWCPQGGKILYNDRC